MTLFYICVLGVALFGGHLSNSLLPEFKSFILYCFF